MTRKGIKALAAIHRAKISGADMRGVEMRAPGALYHKGTNDDTDIGYALELRSPRPTPEETERP